MPGHQQLGGEERPVGGAEDEYVVCHVGLLNRALLARGLDVFVIETAQAAEHFIGVLSEERRAANVRR
jgi:hypothetical protein